MTWAVVDTETTTRTSFKRKANPFDPENWIVMAGWCTKEDTKPQGMRLAKGRQDHDWFINLLQGGTRFLVGANIKFDLLHILKSPPAYEAWMAYVVAGGNVWDVQLAEYLLDGQIQASHMLSLDELAVRYGCDTKVDEVKLLWEAGVATEDIDPVLLSRYLLGEDLIDPITKRPTGRRREGDIGNTRDIFLAQLERAKKQGQSRSILMNMGSLICSTEMERNGMHVDKALGLQLAAELSDKLQAARAELEQYLPSNLPFEFNWTNRYHLSPLVFGGVVNYDAYEYDLAAGGTMFKADWDALADKPERVYASKTEQHVVLQSGRTMPLLMWEHLQWQPDGTDTEAVRYSSGKNAGELKTKQVKVPDTTKPKGRMVRTGYTFPGYTYADDAWASSTPGLYSVAEDVIEVLTARKGVPFLKVLTSVINMSKDLSTYFISEKDGEAKGMLTLVQADSMIHHMINHTSTVTGRFSGSNPNLQNIPKGNKSEVKRVFTSRFKKAQVAAAVDEQISTYKAEPAGVILQSDFSSLEVYVQAILTMCRNLIADLKAGIDLHCMRLALKEKMDYDTVFALCKGDKYDEAWDYKRTDAKVFSFQRAYGAGVKKIADSTGMDPADVEALIAAELERWPEIDKYFEARTAEIKRNRKPTSVTVPHPDNAAIMCQLGISRVRTPDGKLYTYRESPSMSFMLKRGELTSFSPTEIKNYEVQGGGAEWMKAAMWLMVRSWYARRNFNGLSLLVNTVHDAAYADTHDDVRDEAAALLHACMLAASDFIEWWFTWKLPLPVPSDTVWGLSMADENKFASPEFKARSSELRAELRRTLMGGYLPQYLKETNG